MPTSSNSAGQRRVLGLASTVAIVVASMIGAGIFVNTGKIGPSLVAPSTVLLVWLVCGFLALCGAMSLGELGAMIPSAGGSYAFVRRAFGPFLGCFVGLEAALVSFPASLAIIALAMGRYAEQVLPWIPARLAAIVTLIVITLIHCRGTLFGARINSVGAALKVGLLACFIVFGLILPVPETSVVQGVSDAPGIFSSSFASAVVIVFFAYQGWAIVTVVGGEIKRPGRNIPLGILGAVLLVTAIYVLVNIVYLRAVAPVDMVNEIGEPTSTIGSLVAMRLFPAWVSSSLDILIVLFMISTILSVTLAGGRMAYAMAVGGQLHGSFTRLNRRGSPVPALLLQAAISVALAAFFSIGQLLIFSGLIGLFTSSIMIGSLLILRRREPDLKRPFRVPLYPAPPLIFIAISLWLAWSAGRENPIEIAVCALAIAILGVLAMACTRLSGGMNQGGGTVSSPEA